MRQRFKQKQYNNNNNNNDNNNNKNKKQPIKKPLSNLESKEKRGEKR